jgi:hypothetical protein
MTRIPSDASEVHAPESALAWAASYSWIRDRLDLDAVHERPNDLVVSVDDDRWVRDVTGAAPLSAVIRVDRDLQELTDRLHRLASGLIELAEEVAST